MERDDDSKKRHRALTALQSVEPQLRGAAMALKPFALGLPRGGRADDGHAVGEARCLEHDPEKWMPVFGKDHAKSKK